MRVQQETAAEKAAKAAAEKAAAEKAAAAAAEAEKVSTLPAMISAATVSSLPQLQAALLKAQEEGLPGDVLLTGMQKLSLMEQQQAEEQAAAEEEWMVAINVLLVGSADAESKLAALRSDRRLRSIDLSSECMLAR